MSGSGGASSSAPARAPLPAPRTSVVGSGPRPRRVSRSGERPQETGGASRDASPSPPGPSRHQGSGCGGNSTGGRSVDRRDSVSSDRSASEAMKLPGRSAAHRASSSVGGGGVGRRRSSGSVSATDSVTAQLQHSQKQGRGESGRAGGDRSQSPLSRGDSGVPSQSAAASANVGMTDLVKKIRLNKWLMQGLWGGAEV